MKVALLGAGLGSVGSYLALSKLNLENNVTIFNSDQKISYKRLDWNENNLKKNYLSLFKKLGIKSLNSKSLFGTFPYKKENIWNNNFAFGLSKFWGGVIQIPSKTIIKKNLGENFDTNVFKNVLGKIPTTLPTNDFQTNEYKEFHSEKTINCHEIILNVLNRFSEIKDNKSVKFGINSVAINNNQGRKDNDCINCTNCIIGCPKDSFFNSERFFKNIKISNEKIEKINIEKNLVVTKESSKLFDKIIFNLGPYENQKYLLENFDNLDEIHIKDSFSYTIPIYFKGKASNQNNYYGLTNLTANFLDNDQEDFFSVQFFPPTDHIIHSFNLGFDNFLTDTINNKFLKKFIFARVYLSDRYAKKYTYYKNKKTKIFVKDTKHIKKKIFDILQKILIKDFKILNFTINSGTSSHYTGYNVNLKEELSKLDYKDNFIIPDSTFWKINPSISPSLSIMANSYHKVVKSNFK